MVGVFAALAAILNITPLRRKLISDHVLAIFRRILPDMSQTEKEAIDAGTVWWDADLFSGKPDWNKMLAIPRRSSRPKSRPSSTAPARKSAR